MHEKEHIAVLDPLHARAIRQYTLQSAPNNNKIALLKLHNTLYIIDRVL